MALLAVPVEWTCTVPQTERTFANQNSACKLSAFFATTTGGM